MRYLSLLLCCLFALLCRAQTTPDTLPKALVCQQLREDFRAAYPEEEKSATERLNSFLSLAKRAQYCDPEFRIVLYANIAQQYARIGRYDSLLLFAEQALYIYEEDTSAIAPDQAATIITTYGNALFYHHQYAASIEQEYRSLRIRERHQLPQKGNNYENIALVYEEMKEYDKAIKHYLLAQKEYQKKESEHWQWDLAALHSNMGNAYSKMHDVKKAMHYFGLAMDYAKANDDPWIEMDVIRIQVPLETELHNYATQLTLTNRGIALATEYADSLLLLELYNERFIANTFLRNLDAAQQDRKKIEFLLPRISSALERSVYYESLTPYFIALEEYDSAALYYRYYQNIEDSLREAGLAEAVAEIETRYETDKKIQQIHSLELENEAKAKRERLYWIIGLLLVILLVALGFLYRWRTQRNQQLRELNALKDRFFSIIAHDLKTPLVGFRSITEALQNHHTTLPKERVEYFLNQLNHASNKLYDLLQNLLYWALSQNGRLRYAPQALSLWEQVDSALELLVPSAAIQDITLSQAISEDIRVWADPQLLQTILRNLLDNAVKFTPTGGRIGVEAQTAPDGWRIKVCDTGLGMTEAQRQQLLQGQLSATRNESAGTGLGLVLCRELVKRQGGELGIDSQLGQGSCFWFTLPKPSTTQ